jgi:hypothetical protein
VTDFNLFFSLRNQNQLFYIEIKDENICDGVNFFIIVWYFLFDCLVDDTSIDLGGIGFIRRDYIGYYGELMG